MRRQTWAGKVDPTQAPTHMGWEGLDASSSAHPTHSGHQRSPGRYLPNHWDSGLQNTGAESPQRPPEEKENADQNGIENFSGTESEGTF